MDTGNCRHRRRRRLGQRILRHRGKAGCAVLHTEARCVLVCHGSRANTGVGAQRVVVVDDAYLTAQAATVRERLKMAGMRLAAILNTALVVP